MKKKRIWLVVTILLVVALWFLSAFITPSQTEKIIEKPVVQEEVIPEEKKDGINIERLRKEYQNEDIIGYIEIPEVVAYPILQTDNNDYYLNHNIQKASDIKGSIFMDYRVNMNDRKILIYGHSGKEENLPFLQLNKYIEESFYKEHKYIMIYSNTEKYTYEIFSSYIETSDYDYVNIKSFNGLTWLEHIQKLKNKSLYETSISLKDSSKILILQTCSMNEDIRSSTKFQLVVAVLIKTEKNNYE